ncbi:MAG: phosphatase PAP2 family protein [Leucobacter sp.]
MSTLHTSRVPNRALIPCAIFAILLVTAFGAYFRFLSGDPLPFDNTWRGWVQLTLESGAYPIATMLAEVGSAFGVAAFGVISAALLFTLKQPRAAATVLTSLVIGVALSQLLKLLVDRPRPLDAVYFFSGESYPSGHAMGAAAFAVSLSIAVSSVLNSGEVHGHPVFMRWVWIVACVWIAAMMWSRTALGVHWLSDAIAGALIGIAAALIATRIWLLHNADSKPNVSASA